MPHKQIIYYRSWRDFTWSVQYYTKRKYGYVVLTEGSVFKQIIRSYCYILLNLTSLFRQLWPTRPLHLNLCYYYFYGALRSVCEQSTFTARAETQYSDRSWQHFNTTAPSLFSIYFRTYEACSIGGQHFKTLCNITSHQKQAWHMKLPWQLQNSRMEIKNMHRREVVAANWNHFLWQHIKTTFQTTNLCNWDSINIYPFVCCNLKVYVHLPVACQQR